MAESYDRRKTAATIDLHSKWSKINDSLRKTEEREFSALLKHVKGNTWMVDITSV